MNFTVIREHRDYFRKHHWIECDEVISKEDLKRLTTGIPQVLVERVNPAEVGKAFDKSDFVLGHDLWRGGNSLKKIILNRSLASIASELIEQKPLRFGYDNFFPAVSKSPAYESFLKTTPTLQEMSCIQGVLCGAMICLSGSSEEITKSDHTTSLFSTTPGNVVFLSPDWPLPLHEIYQNPGFSYLLVVYVKTNAVYFAQQSDPFLHDFKRLGYNFGDRLKEPYHPIVYT